MRTSSKDPFATPREIARFMAQGTGRKPQKIRDELGRVTGWRVEMAQPRPVAQQAKVIVAADALRTFALLKAIGLEPQRSTITILRPRPRPRGAGRPAAARRTSSSSTTSSCDPGGDDSDEDSAAAGSSRSAVVA